jgi:hypothetical protein
MRVDAAKYDDDDAYYAVNLADYDAQLNSTAGAPEIVKELRKSTVEILLAHAKKADQQVVKVAIGSKPPAPKVRGYATFLQFVVGSTLGELEQKLGFRTGVLQAHGAYIYHVNEHALNDRNIVPRGNTDWSAGVSPRDLHNLSRQSGVPVGYHRDYPAATIPIIQFCILEPVPYVGQPRFVKPGQTV